MKNFVKTYWKIIVFFTAAGLVGGFFTGLYVLDSYPAEMQQEILDQGLNSFLLGIITAVQAAFYGLVLGTLGIIIAKSIGLWKDFSKLEKKPVISAVVVAVIGGLLLIQTDIFFFGNYSQAIMDSYSAKPNIVTILASIIYGGVIEEVMLRLFMMSLVALILHKIFEKGKEETSASVFVIANIISAMLFAAGHLPTTSIVLGITPMILLRCFLLNGGIGLLFGRLYRKYGLQYAMIAHAGCHVVSKAIWLVWL